MYEIEAKAATGLGTRWAFIRASRKRLYRETWQPAVAWCLPSLLVLSVVVLPVPFLVPSLFFLFAALTKNNKFSFSSSL